MPYAVSNSVYKLLGFQLECYKVGFSCIQWNRWSERKGMGVIGNREKGVGKIR